MEVGCRVETEDPRTGERRYTTKAYLTFVALDSNGRPRKIPESAPVTREEKRRYRSAEARRKERLHAAGRAADAEARRAPLAMPSARKRGKAHPSSRRRAASKTRA
jgi:hypothetical protein